MIRPHRVDYGILACERPRSQEPGSFDGDFSMGTQRRDRYTHKGMRSPEAPGANLPVPRFDGVCGVLGVHSV